MKTVLVVDDEAGIRQVCQMVLMPSFNVIQAASAEEAEVVLQSVSIDLLITDVAMPGKGGAALVEHVLATYPTIRVLYMSGTPDNPVVVQHLANGDCSLLPKPFTSAKLKEVVNNVLREVRLRAPRQAAPLAVRRRAATPDLELKIANWQQLRARVEAATREFQVVLRDLTWELARATELRRLRARVNHEMEVFSTIPHISGQF